MQPVTKEIARKVAEIFIENASSTVYTSAFFSTILEDVATSIFKLFNPTEEEAALSSITPLGWDEVNRQLVMRTDQITLWDNCLDYSLYFGTYTVKFTPEYAQKIRDNYWAPVHIFSITLDTPFDDWENGGCEHPHVQGGAVCLGEGSAPFRVAYEQFDIVTMFDLINSILHNYDPEGAYRTIDVVSTEDYDRCSECGYRIHIDNSYYCEACSSYYCSDCTDSCHVCCINTCPCLCDSVLVGGKTTCFNCAVECIDCGINIICNDAHLVEDNSDPTHWNQKYRCEYCYNDGLKVNEKETSESTSSSTGTSNVKGFLP